jgi:hypothetical protein
MATTSIDIATALVESGTKFRKDVLMTPVVQLQKTLQYMRLRTGVRGKEVVGGIKSDAGLRPYRTAKDAKQTTTTKGRILETFLGDVVEEFDPSTFYNTIYGENIANPISKMKIVQSISIAMAAAASSKLGINIFNAVRNAAGDTTADLFNGFSTVTATEVTAGNVATAKGNYIEPDVITVANVGDILLSIFQGADEVLKDTEKLEMFVPRSVKELYDKWYLAEFGAVAYNKQFEQSILHGTEGAVQLVTPVGMKSSGYIYLTKRNNMLVGVDQISDDEQMKIRECDNPKVVQFFMKMYFGVEFESIDKEDIMISKIASA